MKDQLASEAQRARRHRGESEGRKKAWSLRPRRALCASAASWSFVLALLTCAPEIGRPATPESARVRMRRLLSLPREKAPIAAEVLQKSEDGEVAIEDIRFRAGRDVWV